MRIDTAGIAGWEDATVVLEFEHGPVGADGSRCTVACLVQIASAPPKSKRGNPYVKISGGWKRTIWAESARCSPADTFCKETGRRVALARLARNRGVGHHPKRLESGGVYRLAVRGMGANPLVAAAIHQYYQNRARARRR